MKRNISLILCCVLSAVVANTCIQIEVWHFLAGGGMLPNREGGKLRYSAGTTEWGWRRMIARDDPTLEGDRPLTEAERAEFVARQRLAIRRNKVVSWTRGMGTLQYLLAPAAAIWSIVLLIKSRHLRRRLVASLLCALNGISIVLMLYRGYFND